MITIPTSELIGGLSDVLPHISDPKGSATSGVKIAWTGEALVFTTYDVYSGVDVHWIPGEGDEAEVQGDQEDEVGDGYSITWGGEDDPWSTFVYYEQAKEIVKVFKLPAKLWRMPVTLKCSPTGDRVTIEREDGPRVGRFLQVQADPGMTKNIPDVRAIAYAEDRGEVDGVPSLATFSPSPPVVVFSPTRLAAFGLGRPLGVLRLVLGNPNEPAGIMMGRRLAGFIYQSDAKGVHPYSVLRDGAGVVA